MYRVSQRFAPSGVTVLGGAVMAGGALIYMNDAGRTLRNVHWDLWVAFALMAAGALIAMLGTVFVDRGA